MIEEVQLKEHNLGRHTMQNKTRRGTNERELSRCFTSDISLFLIILFIFINKIVFFKFYFRTCCLKSDEIFKKSLSVPN